MSINKLHAQNKVKIIKEDNQYKLLINEKETFIKGVGCGLAFGKSNENYLKMAKELGANAVRTWGIDQGNLKYLDEAYKQNLYVFAGLWLNPVYKNKKCSYLTDTKYQIKVRKKILSYVKKYKNHPSIIFWNVGNEVFLFTKDEQERIGFARFLNSLIKAIKQIDKEHPVIYTSSAATGLDYIIKYVPQVDAFGMNLYGGASLLIYECKKKNLNKPIFITEFGPLGEGDCQKDINKLSIEPNDNAKAIQYRNLYSEITNHKNAVCGVFAFHLGETTPNSLSWWNINFHNLKRPAYAELFKLYNNSKEKIIIPKIKSFKVSKQRKLKKGEWIEASLIVSYPNKEELEYEYFCSSSIEGVLQYYVNKRIPISVKGSGPLVKIQVPAQKGVFRLYGLVKNKNGYASIHNVSISVE